jgi:dihydropyrimidinase/dihydroorotase
MAHDLVFKNGLVVTPTGLIRGGVSIDGETITHVGADHTLGEGRREVDLDGRILFPGLMDPHMHFGFGDDVNQDTQVTDFAINTRDCMLGGVTTMATTTLISADPLATLVDQTRESGADRSFCDFKVTAVVGTREHVDEIPGLVSEGVVSFKFFTGYVGAQAELFGMQPEGITPALFYEACEAIKKGGTPAFAKIHAEEPTVRGLLIDRLRQDPSATRLTAWAETSRDWAESAQLYTYGQIASEIGVPIYPVHVSSAETLNTIRWMRSQGKNIVAETLALFLNTTAEEMDEKGMGGKAKIQPPIRHEHDKEALWQALADGTISTIGTDSLTYSARFKSGEDFWDCRVGVNLQVADTLPLMMTEGYSTGRLDLVTMAKLLSENSARRYGLYPRKGAIAPGSDADLVVIDPDKEIQLGVDRYLGNSDYSLWEGRRAKGVPVMTTLRGRVIMEDGEIVADKSSGKYLVGL